MAEIWQKETFFVGVNELYKRCRQYRFKTVEDKDFSLSEVIVLRFLSEHPEENTVKAISEHVNLSKGLVSRSVESLRQKGFLIAKADAQDRRKVLLTLCPEAERYVLYFEKRQEDFDRRMLEGVSQEELCAAARTFQKLLENIMKINEED